MVKKKISQNSKMGKKVKNLKEEIKQTESNQNVGEKIWERKE